MAIVNLAALASIGPLFSLAAVTGIAQGLFGLWPGLGLAILGWAATLALLARGYYSAARTPAALTAGLKLVERRFSEGDSIIREGDPATCLYVIISGKVQVWRKDEYGARIDIAELVPGQFFGEMGLLNSGTRTASVEAVGPVRLFEVSREMFETIVSQSGSVATLVREVAERRRSPG